MSTLIFAACNGEKVYAPQDLRKLSNEEIIERVRSYDLPVFNTVFRDQRGLIISGDSLSKLYLLELVFAHTYVNAQDQVVEIIVPDDIAVDSTLMAQLQQAFKEGPQVTPATVDCQDLKNILIKLEKDDQAMRSQGKRFSPKDDLKNLSIAMGIIENCGMTTSEDLNGYKNRGLWLVFQHAPHKYRKQYFPYFQQAAEARQMPRSQIAMMEDRLLLYEGKPQIYGSQVKRVGNRLELDTLIAPEYVDQRRANMGMGSLKEYLAHYNIAFNIPQKRK